jgi:hypothetical protein
MLVCDLIGQIIDESIGDDDEQNAVVEEWEEFPKALGVVDLAERGWQVPG